MTTAELAQVGSTSGVTHSTAAVFSTSSIIALPSVPPTWDAKQDHAVLSKLHGFPAKVDVEPAGRWFETYAARSRSNRTISSHDDEHLLKDLDGAGASALDDDDDEEEGNGDDRFDQEEHSSLQYLDPADWKKQDHYLVMGLSKLRWRANDDDIKKAFKRKVLVHHPDKKKAAKGGKAEEGEDDFFKCLKRANEILSDPVLRRSFDSVDPNFDNSVPEVTERNKKNFYAVFGPAIERNAHWFVKQPAPLLGGPDDDEDTVENFYSFWYTEETWREFSYEDEEDKSKAENRDERRWIEKENKAARAKKKKAETVRLRTLVDNCSRCDPRLIRFKALAMEKKNAVKNQKALALKQAQEEKERLAKAEAEAKQKAALEQKEIDERAKKDKEDLKKQQRTQRKRFRNNCKEHNYFVEKEEDVVHQVENSELLCEKLSMDRLKALNDAIESGKEIGAAAFDEELARLKHEEEQAKAPVASRTEWESKDSDKSPLEWSFDDVQVLVRAVKSYPPGSLNRWEAVRDFLLSHSTSGVKFTTQQVIARAKELQKIGTSVDNKAKDLAHKETIEKVAKLAAEPTSISAAPTTNFEDGDVTIVASSSKSSPSEGDKKGKKKDDEPDNSSPWTAEEQNALQIALKAVPATDPERWEKIAEAVATRSKKDCVRRVKELAELVKAKKSG